MKHTPKILILIALTTHLFQPMIYEELQYVARLLICGCLGGLIPWQWRKE